MILRRRFVSFALLLTQALLPMAVATRVAHAQRDAPPDAWPDSPPSSAQAPPSCGCECPNRWRSRERPDLRQGTTDLQLGFDLSWSVMSRYADGPSAQDLAVRLDAAVTRRFRQHAAFRGALEPLGMRRDLRGTYIPMMRTSVLMGYSSPVLRAFAGVSFWKTSVAGEETLRGIGGMQGLVRLEAGRPTQAMLVLQGGTGVARTLDDEGENAIRRLGYSGEMMLQLPFPLRRREVGAIRLVTRWFGAVMQMYGEAGLDLVIGRRAISRVPIVTVGYRWVAAWMDDGASLHGFRVGTEWYGLGRPRPQGLNAALR